MAGTIAGLYVFLRLSPTHAEGLVTMAGSITASSYLKSLSPDTRQLLTEGMEWMDTYYDSDAGYLYDFSSRKALRHETRNSVWYALGLLARNKGTDVAEAEKIINNVIAGQYKVPSDAW